MWKRQREASQNHGPVYGDEHKVQQHGCHYDEDDVLEGLLHEAVVRRAQLHPHDDQQRAVIQQAHGDSMAGHPSTDRLEQIPDSLRRT